MPHLTNVIQQSSAGRGYPPPMESGSRPVSGPSRPWAIMVQQLS